LDRAKLQKAESLLNSNRFSEAEQLLKKVIKKDSRLVQAYIMLASIYGQTARYDDVVKVCNKIIRIHPHQPIAHSLIGSAYVLLGKTNQAIEHLNVAHQHLPNDPGVLTNLGNALYATGDIDAAMRKYQAALHIISDYPLANFGYGNCLLALGKWSDAVTSYRKAYIAMKDNYDINMSLGKAYTNIGALDQAIGCYQRAMGLAEQPAIVLYELAKAHQLKGDLKAAIDYVEQSLEYLPDDTHAQLLRAEIQYKMGDIDDAYNKIHELVETNQLSSKLLEVYGNLCHHYDECEKVISLSESYISSNSLGASDATSLHYSLGKLYDKAMNFEKAFSHYSAANEIMPGEFDRENHYKLITSLISGYNKEGIKSLLRSECADERPVFIVGMPRSGTSLVEQILAGHPDVYGAGELGDVKDMSSKILKQSGDNNTTCFRDITKHQLNELSAEYVSMLDTKAGNARRVTDKMPANYLWLGVIMQLFPRARIIHCQRDPRDTCLSIFFQQFTKGHTYANDLADLSFYYRQYERLMSHWREVIDIPMIEIKYADLVDDLERNSRKLIDFLGLAWNDSCLDFHKSKRTTATASWDQVRQPIYTSSLGRWRCYKPFIGALIAEFGEGEVPIEKWTADG
jgi:tetratricopeptide (TPR) repeat protein